MRDLICIGASAGGVEALTELAANLPPDLPASLFVVLHIPPFQPSRLDHILDRVGPFRACLAKNGEQFSNGRIYIAPPDHHLLVEAGRMIVVKGPKENRFRPAIDPLFRSMAQHYAHRAVGVLLSGLLDDGTAGLWALKRSGGLAVTQDARDAKFPDMARNERDYVQVDHVCTAAQMGELFTSLLRTGKSTTSVPKVVTEITRIENEYSKLKDVPRSKIEKWGKPSSMICPSCNGPLWLMRQGPKRFRCHTGHAFTPSTLIEEHRWLSERTLDVLMTLFDDEVTLAEHVLDSNRDMDRKDQLKRDLRESVERAATLRTLLRGGFKQTAKIRR